MAASVSVTQVEDIHSFSVDHLVDYFKKKNVTQKTIDNISDNQINGGLFLQLSESDLKELAPLLCDRVILRSSQSSSSPSPLQFTKDANLSTSASPVTSPAASEPPKPAHPLVVGKSPGGNSSDDSWVEGFQIPTLFSARTMDCLSTGILSQSCRTEIVQTLAAHMWVHTRHPSKYAYNAVCTALVKVHPTLADDVGDDQVAHLSWKQKLRDRFKFLRRPPTGTTAPQSKRRRVNSGEPSEEVNMETHYDDEDFERDIKDIEAEMKKRKKNSGELCRLMENTFYRRQKWIKEELPIVDNILLKYPALKHAKVLKQEFRSILKIEGTLTSLLDNWGTWKERIVRYARVESTNRRNVAELLESYDESDMNDGEVGVICLKIMCELFIPRNRESGTIVQSYPDTINIEEEIHRAQKNFPYLLVLKSSEKFTFITVVEREILITTENFGSALLYLLGSYYVFNIAYPKLSYPVLIFLQRYVLGIEDSQAIPKSVRQAVTLMNRFDLH